MVPISADDARRELLDTGERQPRLLASVSCVDGMLREQLSQDQLRLLQVIFEPFDRERGSPI